MPYARLALGARFSKHERVMGTRRESEYRTGLVVGFGGGLNVMLGRKAMAGLSFAYISSVSGKDTADGLELGLSIAGLWSVK